jgi:hypothetical protein
MKPGFFSGLRLRLHPAPNPGIRPRVPILIAAWLCSFSFCLGQPASAQAPTGDPVPAEPLETAAPEVEPSQDPSAPYVALARFTTAVENREPVDAVTFIGLSQESVTFFTDLRNMNGETVIHRWEFGGEIAAEVRFEVGGPRWRVWSTKTLGQDQIGTWTASVVNSAGEVLASESFTLQEQP